MRMCPESESFLHIFFQHGYLTYDSTYLVENVYVCFLDVYGGKRVSKCLYGAKFLFYWM